jgi:hypothetical protein
VGDEDGGDAGLGESGQPGAEPEPGADALLDRLVRARANLARERAAAPALWRELAETSPCRQLAAVEGDARFHTFGLCELLLAEATGALAADPAQAGRLAALALASAARLDPELHPRPVVCDLEARAWAAAGEAHRAAGELSAAEEALAAAAACLAHGTGDPTVDARLLEFEAAVRVDQGRPGAADALLRQAASRYLRVNERELAQEVEARRAALRAGGDAADTAHPAFGEGG